MTKEQILQRRVTDQAIKEGVNENETDLSCLKKLRFQKDGCHVCRNHVQIG